MSNNFMNKGESCSRFNVKSTINVNIKFKKHNSFIKVLNYGQPT